MPSAFHIGRKIKEVWKLSGLTGANFAEKLHRQRQSIYHLFGQESIDTRLLKKISQVLNHDFFGDYSKELDNKRPNPEDQNNGTIQMLSHAIDHLSEEVKNLAETQDKKRT